VATSFPSSLDTLTNPTSGSALNSPDHAGQHADANDAIEALQAKVGVDGSAVTTSLDYKVAKLVPAGSVLLWAGGNSTSIPTGYLLCDGSAVSRTTYASLFSAIGTAYGAGDGSTTFNVPSMSARLALGTTANTRSATTVSSGNASATHTHNTTTGNASATHTHNGTSGNASANHTHNANYTVTTGNDNTNHTHTYDKSNGSNSSANSGGVSAGHTHTWNANLTTGGDGSSHTHNTTTGTESAVHTHNGTSGNESATHSHTTSATEFIYIIKT
jgi:microcystin-dependent protein